MESVVAPTLRVGLVSLDMAWEEKGTNLARCAAALERATARGCRLVVFPEMTLTGFSMNTAAIAEDPERSESIEAFRRLARDHGVALVAGVVLRAGTLATNNLIFADPAGEVRANYAKLHPFSFSGEGRYYTGGSTPATARLDPFVLGFSICYDLRFPELFGALSRRAEVLVNIANWPRSRADHWRVLLRARAIENQAFVVGVNRTGRGENGIEYERTSSVVCPEGNPLAPLWTDGDLEVFDLERQRVDEYRERFPTLRDRRPQLYREFLED